MSTRAWAVPAALFVSVVAVSAILGGLWMVAVVVAIACVGGLLPVLVGLLASGRNRPS